VFSIVPDLTLIRFLKADPNDLIEAALGVFLEFVKEKFKEIVAIRKEQQKNPGQKAHDDMIGTLSSALFKLLMKADHMSVRQFLGT